MEENYKLSYLASASAFSAFLIISTTAFALLAAFDEYFNIEVGFVIAMPPKCKAQSSLYAFTPKTKLASDTRSSIPVGSAKTFSLKKNFLLNRLCSSINDYCFSKLTHHSSKQTKHKQDNDAG